MQWVEPVARAKGTARGRVVLNPVEKAKRPSQARGILKNGVST